MLQVGSLGAIGVQTLMNALDNASIAASTDVFTSPGLVIGTSSTAAVKIANTTTFKLLGQFYSKTTAEIAFTATAANNIANGYEQVFMLTLDYGGNGLLIPGSPSLGAGTALLPERPAPVLLTTTSAITATGSQSVSVANVPSLANLAVNSYVLVDNGANYEALQVTAIATALQSGGPAITINPSNNHPIGTLIKQVFAPIGYVRIYNNSGSAFTAGTTALSTSGLTVTYTNGYPFPLFQQIF